jgi:phosphoglycolate phosphatase
LYSRVFRELFGRELETVAPMAGRTDWAIIRDTLARAGVAQPQQHVCAFAAGLAAQAPELGAGVRARGRVLPGAVDALHALAAMSDGSAGAHGQAGLVVQSVLTGNLRPLAEVKIGELGLAGYLDLDVGAYGDEHEVRSDLVRVARDRAAAAYGAAFDGDATVLIGDTPHDVQAARATGARSVAVTTGGASAAELAAAGADVVLPDLTDTAAVVAAILC